MATFEIARGDRLPYLRVQFRNDRGYAVNLTGATVVFVATHERSGRIITGPSVVVVDGGAGIDATDGIVEYRWAAGDTDHGGDYVAKFVADFGGLQMTFPSCPEKREFMIDICG